MAFDKSRLQTVRRLFCVGPSDILFRIFASFVPPWGQDYGKVHVDLAGPLLALASLAVFVDYGYSFKAGTGGAPAESVLVYGALMPVLSFALCKLGRSSVTFLEVAALVGYSLYGHLATLLVSFLCFQESSDFFFFVCLATFGGLSTLRVALLLLGTIAVPAARLLVCTAVAVVNVLYLVFLHFAYMHPYFVFRRY